MIARFSWFWKIFTTCHKKINVFIITCGNKSIWLITALQNSHLLQKYWGKEENQEKECWHVHIAVDAWISLLSSTIRRNSATVRIRKRSGLYRSSAVLPSGEKPPKGLAGLAPSCNQSCRGVEQSYQMWNMKDDWFRNYVELR